MFADFSSTVGEGLLYIFLAVGVLSLLYKKHFPKNEPGEVLKGGFLEWLKRMILK